MNSCRKIRALSLPARLEGLRSSGKSVCGSLEVKGGGPGAPRTKDLEFVSSKYDNELEKAHGNNL